MQEQTKIELEKFLDEIESGKILVDVERYSPIYEAKIQTAVSAKRAGCYNDAVNIYLELFREMHRAHSEVMRFLYKILLCDEELYLAYRTITLAERELIRQCGHKSRTYHPLFGFIEMEWSQTVEKNDLLAECRRLMQTGSINSLWRFIAEKSGNPNFTLKRGTDHLMREAKKILSV